MRKLKSFIVAISIFAMVLFDISPCFDDIDTHAYRKNLF